MSAHASSPRSSEWLGFLPFVSDGSAVRVGFLLAGIVLFIIDSADDGGALARRHRRRARGTGRRRARDRRDTAGRRPSGVVLPAARSGIVGAAVLAAGRALGETMAVTMVVGNSNDLPALAVRPAQTMSSLVANEFGEARDPFHLESLIAVVLLLMIDALILNGVARLLVRLGERDHPRRGRRMSILDSGPVRDPQARASEQPRKASLRRRKLVSAVCVAWFGAALLVAVTPFVVVVGYTVHRGVAAWSAGFFTHLPTPAGIPGGGSPTRSSAR